MAPFLPLLLLSACRALSAQDVLLAGEHAAGTDEGDEGPAVRILNHVLLEAVVLLLIAVVALCGLLVLLGRLLCCFRAGRPGLLEPLLRDAEGDAEDVGRLHSHQDTSRSSSTQTSRQHPSFWARRCVNGPETPARIPIMRRILEARGRLSKTPGRRETREHRSDGVSRSSPKLLGRERLRVSEFQDSKSLLERCSEVPTGSQPTPSEVRKSSTKKSVGSAFLGPMLYHKLFSQATEAEDLREVVYCSLAQPSTSLFSSPAGSPRARTPSADSGDITPRSSPQSRGAASTMVNEDCEHLQPALQRDTTQRMAWSESWLSQATRSKLPNACKTVKLAWSDFAARKESAEGR